MAIKNSILLGTLGKYSDRFHTYQPERTLEKRLEIARNIPRTHGVEPVYPQDIGHQGQNLQLIKSSGQKLALWRNAIKSTKSDQKNCIFGIL